MFKRKSIVVGILIMVWISWTVAGFAIGFQYETTPGASAETMSDDWPTGTSLTRSATNYTFVMAVHPKCPCTRASASELRRILENLDRPVKVYVIFVKPEGSDEGWNETQLWGDVSQLPGVNSVSDAGGVEAMRFEAATSGQSLLYDPTGKLIFRGGITQGRGREGTSTGGSSVISLINYGRSDQSETPVYGCPLFSDDNECKRKAHNFHDKR